MSSRSTVVLVSSSSEKQACFQISAEWSCDVFVEVSKAHQSESFYHKLTRARVETKETILNSVT
jgi:hypothetical protein